MKHVDLRISYRDGRPRVGYLYLSDPEEKSARSKRIDGGMVLDFNEVGSLIGIELLTPWLVTPEGHQPRSRRARPRAALPHSGSSPLRFSSTLPLHPLRLSGDLLLRGPRCSRAGWASCFGLGQLCPDTVGVSAPQKKVEQIELCNRLHR